MNTQNAQSNATHTPGPWNIELDPETDEPRNAGGFAVHHESNEVADGIGSLSDARLIAAAPDLLAALEGALSYLSKPEIMDWLNRSGAYSSEYGKAMITARAAIARAKGVQS